MYIYISIYITYIYIIFFSNPQIKLHNEIHNTAQICATKCTTCFTIKCIKQLLLLFILLIQAKNKAYILN